MKIQLSNFKGINNKAHANKMPEGYLRECVNFSVDNAGMLSKRQGLLKKDNAIYSALWSDGHRCFAVKNGDLVELNANYQATVLRANVGYVAMDFTECDGLYYYVSSLINGIITENTVQSSGQAQVNYQPSLSASIGTMPKGTYLVAVTTLDSNGMESGTKEPVSIALNDNQKIELSNIFVSTDPRVADIAIYCSAANGSELYRIATVNNGTTNYSITSPNVNKFILGTIGINSMPLGQLISYYYGHLYVASDNYLFYSQAWRYQRWQPKNYYRFSRAITAILPCESGLWVSAEKEGLFWIGGKSPNHGLNNLGDMTRFKKHRACLKKGSAKLIEAEFIEQPTYGWMATANEGLFLLLDQGQFSNVSQNNINMPVFSDCAGAIVDDSDSYKYLALMAGENLPSRAL